MPFGTPQSSVQNDMLNYRIFSVKNNKTLAVIKQKGFVG